MSMCPEQRPFALTEQNAQDTKKIPYGVSPETYGLLLFAHDHKEILDLVDSLDRGKNRIINPTRNLLYVYYFNDVSIRDLRKYLGGDRVTNGKRMLEALKVIWQQAPLEIQMQYPKEKAVRLKEDPSNSPRSLGKRRKAAITHWGDQNCREKMLERLKNRKNDPDFIAKMTEIGKGHGSPMEGKRHPDTTTEKITKAVQEIWNKRHGIELTGDPFAKKIALLNEWQRLSLLLEHSPSSNEITKLKNEGKTKFSITMYKQEFGGGSFTKAKEQLDRLTTLAGPSFEATQRLTGYLTSKSKELAKYGITEEDIQKHNAQINQARDEILLATSEQETNQGMERLDLLLSRIQRKISIMTPFYKP